MTAIHDLPPTPRQMEMLRLAAEGLRYREIAERMGIAKKTVHGQLYEARQRLGVRSTAAAIWKMRFRLDEELGLVEPPHPAIWEGKSLTRYIDEKRLARALRRVVADGRYIDLTGIHLVAMNSEFTQVAHDIAVAYGKADRE